MVDAIRIRAYKSGIKTEAVLVGLEVVEDALVDIVTFLIEPHFLSCCC